MLLPHCPKHMGLSLQPLPYPEGKRQSSGKLNMVCFVQIEKMSLTVKNKRAQAARVIMALTRFEDS
jgi:hypothetical protein